jgi:tetratricopeptide (TPR) repeat protein
MLGRQVRRTASEYPSMDPSATGRPVPAIDPYDFIVDLNGRGRAAAAAGDLVAWRGAFALLARTPDRDVRLAAALALDDILRDIVPRRAGAPFAHAAARVALQELERDPYEPARWALLARLCATLGHGAAAAACDAAARRLDVVEPQDLTTGTSFKAARPLADRALALAAEVRPPVIEQRLSAVMIVRDEEQMLPSCLRSIKGVVDEIVVVDTGSRDRTVEIAQELGARVVHRAWDGSFAAARNASLDHATGDWVIVLDADERLFPGDADALRGVLAKPWRTAAHVEIVHATRRDGVGMDVSSSGLRMWRHTPAARYEGIVHEQVAGLPRFLPDRFEHLPARLLHDGYRDEVVIGKGKFERNRRLLEQQIEEADGNARAFAWYNLGVEHLIRGTAEDAQVAFEHALDGTHARGGIASVPWGPMLALRATSARRQVGAHELGERDAARWLEHFPDHSDLAIERAQCAFAVDPERGLRLLDDALRLGDGPARYNSIVGASTHLGAALRGDFLAQLGRHREAVAGYRRGLELNPDYVGGIGGLARSLLCDGTPPADVLIELRPLASRYIAAAGGLLAGAFLGADALEEARAVLAEMQERCPESLEARVGLASCALAEGDTAAARRLCEPLPADPDAAEPLVRCAVFGALVDGDVESATATLADPAAAGLEAAQAEVFRAWAGQQTEPLGADAARAALKMLRTAVQIERLDACDALYRLVLESRLPSLEARDAVAECFFGAGYHDVAADEWITLLEESGPTGTALLGLARVAHSKGEHEDAVALANEARRVDPSLEADALRVGAIAEASQVAAAVAA